MIKCEGCGKPAPVGTEISETGVVTVFRLAANPKKGAPILRTRTIEYSSENEHQMIWLCDCGTENNVASDMAECTFRKD
jgi:hypothetical protein